MNKEVAINVINKSKYGLPQYKTDGSSGMDLYANIDKPVWIWPLQVRKIPTGIMMELVDDIEVEVRSRSGLSTNHGIVVVNAPGTVDTDYRGEIHAPLINLSWKPFKILPGMRVAQMVASRYVKIKWCETDALSDTDRGKSGFGATGLIDHVKV